MPRTHRRVSSLAKSQPFTASPAESERTALSLPYVAPAPLATVDPWGAEDELAAISRRYGHLDFDRGAFAAVTTDQLMAKMSEDYSPGVSRSAKVAAVSGLVAVAAAGAIAWWLWPTGMAAANKQTLATIGIGAVAFAGLGTAIWAAHEAYEIGSVDSPTFWDIKEGASNLMYLEQDLAERGLIDHNRYFGPPSHDPNLTLQEVAEQLRAEEDRRHANYHT